jgi:hypothetical protein
MNTKQLNQIKELRAGIEMLNNDIQLLTNYDDIQNYMNNFMKLYSQVANPNNNRSNKSIIGIINFLKNNPKGEIQSIRQKAKGKRLKHKSTYKDYISEYIILRQRGHSFKSISEYSFLHFKVKVSKETIRKILNPILNNNND